MLILNIGVGDKVRFVDASEACIEERRINTFSDDNIETIINALAEESEISKDISFSEIGYNDYVLDAHRYLENIEYIKNGEKLLNLVEIKRGAPCTARQLDEINSNEPTRFQYLMLNNIQNGVIVGDLPYIKEIPLRFERFCLQDGDIVLSKNGAPFKAAVVRIIDGQQILANGNLYIIRCDLNKIRPYYLKAYLESKQGSAALQRIAVGAAIPNIGIEPLRNMDIPMVSLEKQIIFENKYANIQNKIKMLDEQKSNLSYKLSHLFDNIGD